MIDMRPVKLTYATRDYADCLKTCSATWGPFLNLGKSAKQGAWLDCVGKKIDAIIRWAENQPDGTRFMFMDADCLLFGDPSEAFNQPFDVAFTTGANRDRYEGVPNAGVFFGVTGAGCTAWLRAWRQLQDVYRAAGVGCREGYQAYDQYAFGAACSLPWIPARVVALPESEWNYNDVIRKPVEDIQREAAGAKVIHLKAGRWKDAATDLIKRQSETVDVVMLWVDGDDPWDIRHAIGLGRKNLTGVRNWIVIGGNPAIEGVRSIPFDSAENYDGAERNMISKVLAACDDDAISDPFLLMSDDHFCLLPQHAPAIPFWWKSDMAKRTKGGAYGRRVFVTADVLERLKLPTLNYDAHRPMLIYKDAYRAAIKAADGANVLTKSVYANHAAYTGIKCIDAKDEVRKKQGQNIAAILDQYPWASSNGRRSPEFERYIETALTGSVTDNAEPVRSQRISRRKQRRAEYEKAR